MSITGAADGPPYRLGVAIVDIVSGMFAAYGIAMALFARERTGRGQEVDLAMLDATVALLTYQAGNYFASGKVPARLGNRHPSIVPYETFAASDGEFVLAVGNDDQWRRFCAIAGLPEDARFATNRQRVTGYDQLRPLVADRLRTEPRQYWIDRLTAAGVPCGSVRNFQELFEDPQLAAREMIARVEHATIGQLQDARRAGQALRHAGLGQNAAAHAWPAHERGARTGSRIQRRRDRRTAHGST